MPISLRPAFLTKGNETSHEKHPQKEESLSQPSEWERQCGIGEFSEFVENWVFRQILQSKPRKIKAVIAATVVHLFLKKEKNERV